MNDLQQQPGVNGTAHPAEDAVAETLQDELTIGYKPVLPLESLWLGGGDLPQITLRRDLEWMQIHPIVAIALAYYKSGLAGAEFWGGPDHQNPDNDKGKPISPDSRVAEFVLAHVERYWQRGVPLLQEGYAYGWAPGEHMYREINGMMTWSHLKDFHPNDGFILTMKYAPVGVRIKNVREKQPVDLWFASKGIPAKACWYVHNPRFNAHYGRSQLMGAWRPWRRLGGKDGQEQVIDAAVFRAGYKGPTVRYPPGHSAATAKTGIPATTMDSQGSSRRENRDTARQIGEWAKAGATFTLSSEKYPDTQGGGYKWDVEWPDHVMDVRPLLDAAKSLEDQIFYGVGVPPELVRAGGTGSGYSGRSIPREAFLDGQQRVADALLQIFVEQVVRPLVLWNFGDVPFEVSCKSLLQSQADDKQGQPQGQGGAQQAKPGQEPTPPPQYNQHQPVQQPAMSLDPQVRDRVLGIVRRVLRGRAA
jgi:hypothetical protein